MTALNYATGTASSMADLVSALFSFATGTAGWTQLDLDTVNGEASMHKGGTLFVQFRWDISSPNSLAIYQALGYGHGLATAAVSSGGTGYSVGDVATLSGGSPTTAATVRVTAESGGVVTAVEVLTAGIDYGSTPSNPVSTTGAGNNDLTLTCTFRGTVGSTTPGQSCDDSGSSLISGTESQLASSRCLYQIGAGPYTSHHFFDGTNANGDPYLHVVVEFSPGVFRHMGFGHLDKIGDWKGGEYCYGHIQSSSDPIVTSSSCLLDGLWSSSTTSNNNRYRGATIRIEDFLTQDPTSKWGLCWRVSSSTGFEDDRFGNPRVRIAGGFRAGPIASGMGWLSSNVGNAFIPMYSIVPMFWDSDQVPETAAFMGSMPDIRGLNIKAFSPKDVVTIGADDWMLFPMSRKANGVDINDSRNSGIAYLRP